LISISKAQYNELNKTSLSNNSDQHTKASSTAESETNEKDAPVQNLSAVALLSQLEEAPKPYPPLSSWQELATEYIISLFFAGHKNPSICLTHTICSVYHNKNVFKQVQTELKNQNWQDFAETIDVLQKEEKTSKPTNTGVVELPFVDSCVAESLRQLALVIGSVRTVCKSPLEVTTNSGQHYTLPVGKFSLLCFHFLSFNDLPVVYVPFSCCFRFVSRNLTRLVFLRFLCIPSS
jgi:hypothetical protein